MALIDQLEQLKQIQIDIMNAISAKSGIDASPYPMSDYASLIMAINTEDATTIAFWDGESMTWGGEELRWESSE